MSSANSPDWQMCRLRRETVDRLRRIERSLEHARERGLLIHGEPGEQGWSVDQLVAYLCGSHERHMAASKRANAKVRDRRRALAERLARLPVEGSYDQSEPAAKAEEGREGE